MNNKQKGKYRKNPARAELEVVKIEPLSEWDALIQNLLRYGEAYGVPPHLFEQSPGDSTLTNAKAVHNLFLQQLGTIE